VNRVVLAAAAGLLAIAPVGCGGSLNAGQDVHQPLPVDQRNPVLLVNDSCNDNWIGEYAVLLAASGGPPLAGLIVGASSYWPDLSSNASGWQSLLTAARASGLKVPDLTKSTGAALARPADGAILSTVPNRSAGAQQIVTLSKKLSLPWRPLVVMVGGKLTDVADAYLMDPSVADRVVVVAALGTTSGTGAAMAAPNGELDPWADWIVAQKFRYVQVSAYYDQTGDVTTAQLASLPKNPLGSYMAAKQPNVFTITTAADQVAVLAVALHDFVTGVEQASVDGTAAFDSTQGPPLIAGAGGNVWIVTQIAAPLAQARLWQMLLDPTLFSP
jgi:hypothetical protein